jgi:hypothetical protein
MLQRACAEDRLLCGNAGRAVRRGLARASRQEWVVYGNPPFGGATQVVRYLARYTHRVAIANHRIVALSDGRVSFRDKDCTDEQRHKVMSLAAEEFMRRFLLHVLPPGFARIRHYGILAKRDRQRHIALCRQRIAGSPVRLPVMPEPEDPDEAADRTPQPLLRFTDPVPVARRPQGRVAERPPWYTPRTRAL